MQTTSKRNGRFGVLMWVGVACAALAWGRPAWAGDSYSESGSFAPDAHAAGTWRVAAGGAVSNEIAKAGGLGTADGETYGGAGSIGYFVRDNLELGVKVDGRSLDNVSIPGEWWNVDAFLKYYWARERRLVPYVGVQAGGAFIDIHGLGTTAGANLGVIGGFEFMVTRNFAFFAEYNGAYTSQFDPADVYVWSNTGVAGFAIFF